MPKQIDDLLIYRVAKAYYIDDLPQSEIATIEHISRPQISRLLKRAKERGFVEIDVHFPQTQSPQSLKRALMKKYSLTDIIIAPTVDSVSDDSACVLATAVDYLPDLLSGSSSIGIGCGNTLYQLSIQLGYKDGFSGCDIYPLIANSGYTVSYLQTNTIVDRFAEKLIGSRPHYNNNALYEKENRKTQDWYQSQLEIWRSLDAAIIGVGSADPYTWTSYYSDENQDRVLDLREIVQNRFGDILSHVFLPDDKIFEAPDGYFLNSIPLDYLQDMDHVIAVAFGAGKTASLDYAIRKQYVKTLITSQQTAQALLDYHR